MSAGKESLIASLREQAGYLLETTSDRVEEARREVAWLLDATSDRPPIFVPYGVGWGRYA